MLTVLRSLSVAFLAMGIALLQSNDAFACGNAKNKKKALAVQPMGIPKTPALMGAWAGVPKPEETITKTVNELGQTVYTVRPTHFDISPPLLEMANAASANAATTNAPAADAEEEDNEPSSNPMVPASRIIRSGVPDPVVQSVIPSVSPSAPTTGFNFAGVGIPTGFPSDSNGSVGGNQFVETVNFNYQVWSLNRATQVATPVFPNPPATATLWSGFGGACETTAKVDTTVLFDKSAKRWVIAGVGGGSASPPTYASRYRRPRMPPGRTPDMPSPCPTTGPRIAPRSLSGHRARTT